MREKFHSKLPQGTLLHGIPAANVMARNHTSSVVGAISIKESGSSTSVVKAPGGYSMPPTPVGKLYIEHPVAGVFIHEVYAVGEPSVWKCMVCPR